MKAKTQNLEGAALDWAVAKCEGRAIKLDPMGFGPTEQEGGFWIWENRESGHQRACYWRIGGGYSPSTIWAQGGPIIESEKVDSKWLPKQQMWCCYKHQHHIDGFVSGAGFGPTQLIAAMRCYVASKLGDEIEIPEELAC